MLVVRRQPGALVPVAQRQNAPTYFTSHRAWWPVRYIITPLVLSPILWPWCVCQSWVQGTRMWHSSPVLRAHSASARLPLMACRFIFKAIHVWMVVVTMATRTFIDFLILLADILRNNRQPITKVQLMPDHTPSSHPASYDNCLHPPTHVQHYPPTSEAVLQTAGRKAQPRAETPLSLCQAMLHGPRPDWQALSTLNPLCRVTCCCTAGHPAGALRRMGLLPVLAGIVPPARCLRRRHPADGQLLVPAGPADLILPAEKVSECSSPQILQCPTHLHRATSVHLQAFGERVRRVLVCQSWKCTPHHAHPCTRIHTP